MPAAGPSRGWTAEGVVRALEPLLLPERAQRLRMVLERRIGSVTMVLDNPHDPHNGSAIVRSCDAFGIQSMHVLCEREPFLASQNVAKGTHRWVDVFQHARPSDLLETLRRGGFHVVVTHPRGTLSLEDLGRVPRLALVMGNEHQGVGQALSEGADDTVSIPMCGFVESLNVSVSAALTAHAATSGRSGDLTPSERANVHARWLRKSVPRADDILSALEPA